MLVKTNKIQLTLSLIAVLSLFFISRFWKDDPSTNVSYNHFLESDGGGYYNYLPSYFIREDLGNDTTCKAFTYATKNGHSINKYFIGTALMQLPFFLIASVDSTFHYEEINGYEFIIQRDVALASFFYFMLACYVTMRWLSRKFKSDDIAAVSLLLTVLSSGIFYYYTYEPFYSHCESFFLIAVFINAFDKFFTKPSNKQLFIAAISFAGIVLVRPTNGLVILLVPFVAGNIASLVQAWKYIRQHVIAAVSAIIASLAIMCIQPVVNYMQCGNFFEWGYKNEGFIFSQPKIFQLFFSFESGIFIWLPIFLASVIALVIIYRQNKFKAITLAIFLALLFYVYASWWAITYGDSLILRPYTDFTTLSSYLLAVFIFDSHKKYKVLVRVFVIICVLYNIKIFYQYTRKIVHFDRMNFEKFMYTFDKLSDDYKECLGGYRITGINSAKAPKLIFHAYDDFEKQAACFTENHSVEDPINKKNHCLSYVVTEYNTGCDIYNDTAIYHSKYSFAAIKLRRLECNVNDAKDALVVVHLTYPNTKKDFFYTFPVNELPQPNAMTWREWNYSIELPKILYPTYKLTFYVWNIKRQKFYIDDIDVKIYEVM